MQLVNWNEQFKIRTTQAMEERDKHEVVKLLLVRNLIRNHNHNKKWIRIYTEFSPAEGIVCDVYFENVKTKEKYAFEIQKDMRKETVQKKIKKYKTWEDHFFSTDLIIINLNDFSKNIDEINEGLQEYLV